ncbi:hypothetical protein [Delftia deserti]|uniref:Uncharacterized protein n=1 Tax=Delftia deserti TaxID=1651218 RepID=A0ABW5EL96_9BURK
MFARKSLASISGARAAESGGAAFMTRLPAPKNQCSTPENEDGLPYSPRLSLYNGLADSHRLRVGNYPSRLAIIEAGWALLQQGVSTSQHPVL